MGLVGKVADVDDGNHDCQGNEDSQGDVGEESRFVGTEHKLSSQKQSNPRRTTPGVVSVRIAGG